MEDYETLTTESSDEELDMDVATCYKYVRNYLTMQKSRIAQDWCTRANSVIDTMSFEWGEDPDTK